MYKLDEIVGLVQNVPTPSRSLLPLSWISTAPGLVQRPLITLPASPASCLFSTQSQSLKGKVRSCVCSKPAAHPISLQSKPHPSKARRLLPPALAPLCPRWTHSCLKTFAQRHPGLPAHHLQGSILGPSSVTSRSSDPRSPREAFILVNSTHDF